MLLSKCSKKCSQGVKRREVKCVKFSKEGLHLLNETSSSCKQADKPADEMLCNLGDCDSDFLWKVGEWSNVSVRSEQPAQNRPLDHRIVSFKCSSSCGYGLQTRSIHCVNKTGRMEGDISRCSDWTPITSQICYSKCN